MSYKLRDVVEDARRKADLNLLTAVEKIKYPSIKHIKIKIKNPFKKW